MGEDLVKSRLKNKKILIVDDNEDTVSFYLKELKKRYQVETDYAETFKEAIEKIEKTKYDFACIDLYIPYVPKELEKQKESLRPELNQGQLLGPLLAKRSIPYIYLTSVRRRAVDIENETYCKDVIGKNEMSSFELPEKLAEFIN